MQINVFLYLPKYKSLFFDKPVIFIPSCDDKLDRIRLKSRVQNIRNSLPPVGGEPWRLKKF